jgi:hypothetical protein
MPWFYLSFADGTRPRDRQWLGAIFLEAADSRDAFNRAGAIGANPGGQVLALEILERDLPPENYRGRLLGKRALRAMQRAMGGDHRLKDLSGRFV